MTKIDVEELLKILPKLIRENDTVKGAIITALSGVVATKEDIREIIQVMDRRFEEINRRFEEQREETNQRFEKMDQRFEEVLLSIKELSLNIRRLETKEGKLFEKTVLELMRETLLIQEVDPEKIRKEELTDPEGLVFFEGYRTDIDVLLENSKVYLVEVKATTSSQDVAHFLQNAKLFSLRKHKTITQLLLVTLRVTEATLRLAENRGVRVIYGEITID